MEERLERLVGDWKKRFPTPLGASFEAPVMRIGYCARCRFCCGPQEEEEPFPMALLDHQVSARTKDDYWLLDAHTASLDRRGCRALGPCGCRMEGELRPVACGLFPYVLVNHRLYLYRVCPASQLEDREHLVALGKEVAAWLGTLSLSDRERISISRRPEDLAEKYLDLGLAIG